VTVSPLPYWEHLSQEQRRARLPLVPRIEADCHGLHTRCLRFAARGYPNATQDSLPVGRERFATRETVTLSPLLCWEHLSPDAQREKITDLVREIEEEAAAQREAGNTALGRAAILNRRKLTKTGALSSILLLQPLLA